MINNPEHRFDNLSGELPADPEKAIRARNALIRLVNHFYFFPSAEITPQQQTEATRRLYRALEVYSSLSMTVVIQPGIREADREMLIMEGLKAEALIDQSDPMRAHKEYKIISDGYSLNRQHWDNQLGINDGNV